MEFAVREGEIFEKMVLIPGVIEVKFDQQILFNVPRKKKKIALWQTVKKKQLLIHISPQVTRVAPLTTQNLDYIKVVLPEE